MKVLQETTVWSDTNQPNHVYFMNDSKSKAYAYLQHGTKEVFRFKKPIGIDTRGRKFVEVPNQWKFTVELENDPRVKTWTVTGSKGDQYTVTDESGRLSCTCSGFQFRGKCKHLDQVTKS